MHACRPGTPLGQMCLICWSSPTLSQQHIHLFAQRCSVPRRLLHGWALVRGIKVPGSFIWTECLAEGAKLLTKNNFRTLPSEIILGPADNHCWRPLRYGCQWAVSRIFRAQQHFTRWNKDVWATFKNQRQINKVIWILPWVSRNYARQAAPWWGCSSRFSAVFAQWDQFEEREASKARLSW